MPIYEYRCEACRKRVSILTLRVGAPVDEVCEHCGSRRLQRLLSRFAMPRSEEARLDRLADPASMGDVDESDPKSMAKWMRRMGQEMGDELGGGELDEMIDELESGGDAGDESGGGNPSGGGDD